MMRSVISAAFGGAQFLQISFLEEVCDEFVTSSLVAAIFPAASLKPDALKIVEDVLI